MNAPIQRYRPGFGSSDCFAFRGAARVIGVAGILAALGTARDASAQATDVPIKKPNVLLLVDTSGSMRSALDGVSTVNCTLGEKARWTILTETLTGTVDNLFCSSVTPVCSNSCRIYPNLHSEITTALGADPYAWPIRTSGSSEQRDAIVFCPKKGKPVSDCTSTSKQNSAICKGNGINEWEQQGDGLLDTYGENLRFGIMTFESISQVPSGVAGAIDITRWGMPLVHVNGDATWGTPDNCQLDTGVLSPLTRCLFDGIYRIGGVNYTGPQKYGYWHSSGGASSWLNGVHSAYSGNFLMTHPVLGTQSLFSEALLDAGARNPTTPPVEGRMIGFGPPDWGVGSPLVIDTAMTGCSSEDVCTSVHNEMIQKAVLGASRFLSRSTAF